MDELVKYILMRHDPTERNQAYLYPTATVVATVGTRILDHKVDVVRVEVSEGSDVDFIATYQLGRLWSGLEGRSDKVFDTLEQAVDEGLLVNKALGRHLASKTEGSNVN
jgi:4-amino-4-deoxy-L-arabinose transferase-like glycosyltransferase